MITFIDVDCVLAATIEQLAYDHRRTLKDWPVGEYRVHTAWGMTKEEVWAHTDNVDWWADLPLYQHAQNLVTLSMYQGVVALLTAPMGPHSYAGKAVWAKKHFPEVPLIITNDKHLVARPGTMLIDDHDANVEAWRKAGGTALLWGRPWNSNHNKQHFEHVVLW